MSKILIVNGDDFGQSASVNGGIIEAHKRGLLNSASLIVTGSAFQEAVSLAKEHSRLDVGLHLTLTETTPAADSALIPNLAPKGNLPQSYTSLFLGILSRKISREEIRAEFTAQIEKFLQAGFVPSHIDSHQHIHLFPVILNIFIGLAQTYGFRFVRIPNEIGLLQLTSPFLAVRGVSLKALSVYARKRAEEVGVGRIDGFCGLSCSGRLNERNLEKYITRLNEGITELMTHPGLLDEPEINYFRRQETLALVSDRIKELIRKYEIELASFRDL